MFPPEPDPTGNPEFWTPEELKRWLRAVIMSCDPKWNQRGNGFHSC
uniref:Uncharacterized protein n=1 Tax=Coccidioides posadasii RMSCC 3488 TaxID=454284 RepID=A0A0J6IJY6_COCPO|nr:hypothetical protein CPAG_08534 [Coccidioides posadasii RMSCC 3488]